MEIAEEAAEPGLTAERASALRLRRDELEPEPLAETLRGRVDFSLVGDYEDEVGSWRFKPPRGKEARAPPPHPMDSRRPSPDALDHDYRVIVLQEELEEPSEAELLATAFESDARVLFAEDGWPASMKRIAFKDGEAAQKVIHLRELHSAEAFADAPVYAGSPLCPQAHALVEAPRKPRRLHDRARAFFSVWTH